MAITDMTVIFRLIILTWLTLGLSLTLSAQEGFSSSGGDLNGPGGSIAFTLGQTAWSFISSPEGSINEGIQQPLVGMMVGLEPLQPLIDATLYPNPASDDVTIDLGQPWSADKSDRLGYSLNDIFGHQLLTGDINGQSARVPMKALQNGVYLLALQFNNRIIQTFRIIKVD